MASIWSGWPCFPSARIDDAQADLAGETDRRQRGPRAVCRPHPRPARRQCGAGAGHGREPYPGAGGRRGAFRREALSGAGPGAAEAYPAEPEFARSGRSGFSAIRSRSRSPPRFRRGRRPASAGAAPSTASPPPKGRSASRRNGGATRRTLPTRDYFRVEDEDGRRYWLYREGLYGGAEAAPRWFMHGVFA